jgi:hypothetical protein
MRQKQKSRKAVRAAQAHLVRNVRDRPWHHFRYFRLARPDAGVLDVIVVGGLDDTRPLGPTELRLLLICGVKLPPATRRAVSSTFAKTPSLAREQKHATRCRFAAMGLTRP